MMGISEARNRKGNGMVSVDNMRHYTGWSIGCLRLGANCVRWIIAHSRKNRKGGMIRRVRILDLGVPLQ